MKLTFLGPVRLPLLAALLLLLSGLLGVRDGGVPAYAHEQTAVGDHLHNAEKGSIVRFGGKDWILVDPAERKLLLKGVTSEPYFWGYSYQFNSYADYLNSTYRYLNYEQTRDGDGTFYSSLGSDKSWIEPHAFDVTTDQDEALPLYGGASTITEKVGLLTYDDYVAYSADPQIDMGVLPSWYLLTPHRIDDSDIGVYYVNAGSLNVMPSSTLASYYFQLRPVLFLQDQVYVTGGEGTAASPYTLGRVGMELSETGPTDGPVTVTLHFPPASTNQQYKLGEAGAYTAYTAPFPLTANTTVYVKYDDEVPGELGFAVTNLRVPQPAISVSSTAPALSVTVEITYPGNPPYREYRIGDTGAWQSYTVPFTLDENTTVYARACDESGVYSAVTSTSVDNIDRQPPLAPAITLNITAPAQEVVVELSSVVDAALTEYKLGEAGSWQTYTGLVTLTENTTVFARSADALGNVSGISSLAVTNIDRTPPVIFGVADGTSYTGKALPYSMDADIGSIVLKRSGETMNGYSLGTPISDPGSYWLSVTDLAGNVTELTFTVEALPVGGGALASLAAGTAADALQELYEQEPGVYTLTAADDVGQVYVRPAASGPGDYVFLNGERLDSADPVAVQLTGETTVIAIRVLSADEQRSADYQLVVRMTARPALAGATTTYNGEALLVTFDRPMASCWNLSKLHVSGGRTVAAVASTESRIQWRLQLSRPLAAGESVQLTMEAGAAQSADALYNAAVSDFAVVNRTVAAGADGAITVEQLLKMQAAAGTGFSREQAQELLTLIGPRYVSPQ